MKIYKSKEFIDILKHIASLPTTYYSGGNEWSTWNGWSWNFDCVVSIKSVLWGWCEDKNVLHGGAGYAINGVPDFACNQGLDYCEDVSTDFNNLTPGEYLCMKDTIYDHVGIYLGNGKVFEVTTAWGVDGATISDIDTWGNRIKDGSYCLRWTYHGKLQWVDYSDAPEPTPTEDIVFTYKVMTRDYGWLDEVENLNDYAGWKDSAITGLAIKVNKGSIWYQAHIKNGGWLAKVTGYNTDDFINGWAGDGREIDCVRVYYYTPDDVIKESGYKKAKYRINDLPWQYDDETSNGQDGFAGIMGQTAVKFQITIE